MERREFLEFWGGMTSMIGIDTRYESGKVYVLHQFLLDNGEQLGRLHTYLKDALLPALARETGGAAQLVLEAIVAAHQPQIVLIQEFADVAEWRAVTARLREDVVLREANAVWDRPVPYQSHSVSLLAATDYCPPLANGGEGHRIFEMRVYQAPSEWQMNGVHERFAGPEIAIFHRVGIHPVLYASTIAGPQMPNLTYLTPFASLAEREAAWTRFQGDAEWAEVKKKSMETHGFTPRVITISLFKAVAYSPVK
jgi:hypothetical protein